MRDSAGIEPPVTDGLFGEALDVREGEYDRDVWVGVARDVYGVDPDVLDGKPTGWVVARCCDAPNRYYRTDRGSA